MDDAAAEIQTPLHAAAEPFDGLFGPVEQTRGREYLMDPLGEPGPVQPVGPAPEAQVLGGGEVFVEGHSCGTTPNVAWRLGRR